MGHESVLTTLRSYGGIATQRQGEIMKSLGSPANGHSSKVLEIAIALVRQAQSADAIEH